MCMSALRQNRANIALCCALLLTCLVWTLSPWNGFYDLPLTASATGSGPYNDTLGFGAIYVLTEDSSTWRVQGLLQAANLTGLQLQVPTQQHLDDETVRLSVEQEPDGGLGSTRALLNHLALLETISQSKFETALILEDDVDFGMDIKAQMGSLSRAFWDRSGTTWEEDDIALHPYRDAEWDILWPGHFGMSFVQGSEVFRYRDPYALPWSRVTSFFNDYYERMSSQTKDGSAELQQLIFNVAPMSTFAYAITRAHAARLVQKMSVQGIYRKQGTPFDTALHIECVGHGHRCVAPVPQLFHHQKVVGETSIGEEGDGEKQDLSWYHRKHKYTFNIEWSARCNAAHVGERVDRKWQCLPNIDDGMG